MSSAADGAEAGAGTAPRTRLIITHMTLENFKSYAGVQQIGPFHKVGAPRHPRHHTPGSLMGVAAARRVCAQSLRRQERAPSARPHCDYLVAHACVA